MLSPSETGEIVADCLYPTAGMNLPKTFERLRCMTRVLDKEHPKSLPILNELVHRVAQASRLPSHAVSAFLSPKSAAIAEDASERSDHLQAADIAAGHAASMLNTTNGDYRLLARHFRWVGRNGIVIPG